MKVLIVGLILSSLVIAACQDAGTAPTRLDRVQIRLDLRANSLLINDTVRARLDGFDRSGDPYPAGPVTWRSTDPTVVQIDSQGLVQGRGPGSAAIVATVGRLTNSLSLSVAGTLHSQPVTASEVWTLAGAPHVVRGRVSVGASGGATVTIEAGVGVLFEDSAGLTFGLNGNGSLIAQGSAAAPIAMQGARATPVPGSWIGLTFRGRTQSELRHVNMSGCGGARRDEQPRGCLVAGHRFLGPDPMLLVDSVTVADADSTAIVLQGESRFAPGSTSLSARNVRGPVATIPAAAAAAFPLGGSFTGNAPNEVHIVGDTVRESGTWANTGLPWFVLGPVLIEGRAAPVLTIPAGATLRYAFGAGFVVAKGAAGGLRIGTVGAATVNLMPTDPNGWAGVVFWPGALPSSISDAVLDNCGSYNDTGYGQGCVFFIGNFYGTAPAPVFKNVTIRRAVDVSVALVGGGRFGEGSTNVVITETRGSPGAPIYVYQSAVSSIPPGRYTGNGLDAVWINGVEITQSETWPNRGVPYRLGGVVIEHAANPVLTLEPGAVLQLSGGIRVGVLAPGGLRAVGTAEAPVVLSGQRGAQGGTWEAIDIGREANASTLLDHVAVESAGGDYVPNPASIRIARDMGEIVRNTAIGLSGSCGIRRMGPDPWTTDFTAPHLGNTFHDNVGPAQCGP